MADGETLSILEKQGYRLDSSLHNTVYGLSSRPYTPSKTSLNRKGNRSISEIPITVVPSMGLGMRFPSFAPLSDLLYERGVEEARRAIQAQLAQNDGKFTKAGKVVLMTHPQEFVNFKDLNPTKELENLRNLISDKKLNHAPIDTIRNSTR